MAESVNGMLAKSIMDLIGQIYKETGQYKVYIGMLTPKLSKYSKARIATTISVLKKENLLTQLDEVVPNGNNARYFARTDILDKVTQPAKKEEVSEEMTKVPNQVSSKPAATNPFDSVNAKLATISNQLEEFKERFESDVPAFTPEDITKAITNQTLRDYGDILKRIDEVKRPEQLTEAISSRIVDHYNEILSRVDSSLSNAMLAYGESFNDTLGEIHSHLKSNSNSLTDDYQRGLRDGIRMAVEMGLIFRNRE